MRIGLVLGAGGIPGGFFLRAAMASISERTGWTPAMCATVIGTSAGALNAARIDPDPVGVPSDTATELLALAAGQDPIRPTTLDRLLARPRRFAGRAVGRLVPPGKNPQDYDVALPPFHPAVHAVSCLRSTGERRVTRLIDASHPAQELYASAAIPGFTPPVTLDGRDHVDGAIWSTTNADLVDTNGSDLLVVVAPMVPRTGGSLVQKGHRAALLHEIERWSAAQQPLIVVAPTAPALEGRSDHEAFADDARSQILG